MVFALLLHLCAERGRRISRAVVQQMLFPRATAKDSSHSLRQLIYKLRKLGVHLSGDSTFVCIPSTLVQAVPPTNATCSVLPGYSPNISAPFTAWLDGFRGQAEAQLRSFLLEQLQTARLSGDTAATLRISASLLGLDPLNEEAVLARAEALALAGQKADAVKLLSDYSGEVGEISHSLALPADLLKRRISDRLTLAADVYPLLGRSAELAELLAFQHKTLSGQCIVAALVGDAGIGKTRLIQEFTTQLSLTPALAGTARCRPHDVGRPMGPLIDLVPQLLRARGALGVSTESHATLRGLLAAHTTHPAEHAADFVAARLRAALEDLLACVAAESAVVLVVEDAQWLDEPSEDFLMGLRKLSSRLFIVLTYRTNSLHPRLLGNVTSVRKLEPLHPDHALALLKVAIGSDRHVHDELLQQCVSLAAGNALFLCTVGSHFRRHGSAPSSEATLQDLLRQRLRALSAPAQLILRSLITLGAHATHTRLDRCLGLAPGDTLLAIQDLADLGLIVQAGESIQCSHDLLADIVLADTPAPVLVGVAARAAQVLEEDGALNQQPALLWTCADCWSRAKNNRRAATALQQCATVATNVGQPRFAIEALERAQSCVEDRSLGACIEDTIRVADDSWDPEVVYRNLDRIRSWRQRQGRDPTGSTIAEIAALNAARRAEQPVWDKRDLIWRCVANSEASGSDRLRAARIFLLAAEEQLAADAADDIHGLVMASLSEHSDNGAWHHYLLTYHGTFGSLSRACTIAHEILARRNTSAQPVLAAINHAAFVLFRNGQTAVACELYGEFLDLAQRAKLESHTVAQYAAQLAMMLIQLDEIEEAQRLNVLATRSILADGRKCTGGILTNMIELAIARGDLDSADTLSRQLRDDHEHMFTPNRERTAIGNELLIKALRNEVAPVGFVESAEQLFALGATLSESDRLATGLAVTYELRGETEKARRFAQDFVGRVRRDRYPIPSMLKALLHDGQSAAMRSHP
jgi:tetratricopeptide (TPR) repeat protein